MAGFRGLFARRRHPRPQPQAPVAGSPGPRPGAGATPRPAPAVSGVDPGGRPAGWDGGSGVLVFLSAGCMGCREVWAALAGGSHRAGVGLAVTLVTPDPTLEDARAVASLSPADVPVIMSTAAWQAYGVGPAPWVAVVDSGLVVSEGSAGGWDDVAALAGRLS